MSKLNKIETQILSGKTDANFDFNDLRKLLVNFGFDERISRRNINIQPIGSKAKAYQVKQVRNLILKYRLGASDE